MVGSLEVCNLELDVQFSLVSPKVTSRTTEPTDDVVKRRCALGEHVGNVELHLLQGRCEKDVEPASTVDEYLVESGARDYWYQDEWETPWLREACPLICAGEGDGYL
jgi:hypothetical protein